MQNVSVQHLQQEHRTTPVAFCPARLALAVYVVRSRRTAWWKCFCFNRVPSFSFSILSCDSDLSPPFLVLLHDALCVVINMDALTYSVCSGDQPQRLQHDVAPACRSLTSHRQGSTELRCRPSSRAQRLRSVLSDRTRDRASLLRRPPRQRLTRSRTDPPTDGPTVRFRRGPATASTSIWTTPSRAASDNRRCLRRLPSGGRSRPALPARRAWIGVLRMVFLATPVCSFPLTVVWHWHWKTGTRAFIEHCLAVVV